MRTRLSVNEIANRKTKFYIV